MLAGNISILRDALYSHLHQDGLQILKAKWTAREAGTFALLQAWRDVTDDGVPLLHATLPLVSENNQAELYSWASCLGDKVQYFSRGSLSTYHRVDGWTDHSYGPQEIHLWTDELKGMHSAETIALEHFTTLVGFARLDLPNVFPNIESLVVCHADFTNQEEWPAVRSGLQALGKSHPSLRIALDRKCRMTTEQLAELTNSVPDVLWEGKIVDLVRSSEDEDRESIRDATNNPTRGGTRGPEFGKSLQDDFCESDSAEESELNDSDSNSDWDWDWDWEDVSDAE
jgi:hypothetical protein